jgi:hypothetical protein
MTERRTLAWKYAQGDSWGNTGWASIRYCVSLSVLVALVACSGPSRVLASHGAAVINEDRQTVLLPLSSYEVSETARGTMDFALSIVVFRCMKDHGYVTNPPTKSVPGPSGLPYGVWTVAWANKYGYREAQPVDVVGSLEPQEGTAAGAQYTACVKTDEARQTQFNGNSFDLSFMGITPSMKTPQGQAALKIWTQCLKGAGVTPPDVSQITVGVGWTPPEVVAMSMESQITAAVKDVGCKESTGLIPRLTQIDADIEQGVIDAHEAQLAEYSKAWKSVVLRDEKIVADYTRGLG